MDTTLRHRRHLLLLLLPVSNYLRSRNTLHRPSRIERTPFQSSETSATETRQAPAEEEQEIRMQEAERFELHDPDADRGGYRISDRRDPPSRGHITPRALLVDPIRIPRLRYREHTDSIHELLHYPQLSDQLRYLLRHVEAI